MDIRQLRYFVAIVEEGSFSRAAARVNVAQPALSAHVRRMEGDLGVDLLLRSPRGVAPTEAGQVLLSRARLLIADLERTMEEVRSVETDPSGTVRIGLPGTISDILSLPVIAAVTERYPNVKLIVSEAMSGFVKEWVLDGRIDFAVLYGTGRVQGVRQELLLNEELVLLMPPDVEGQGSSLGEFLSCNPLILPSETHGLRAVVDRYVRNAGILVEPVIEIDSYSNIKRLVRKGYGCSILPLCAVVDERDAGDLLLRSFEGSPLWRSAYLSMSSSRAITQAAAAVGVILKEQVARLIAQGHWVGAKLPTR